jgi:hypothetical protein
MTGRTPKALIISMLALAGGVFLFQRIKCARQADREDDARLDDMVEQSFPASDAPAY